MRPESIVLTLSVPGIQPAYLETATVYGGAVKVFDVPLAAMAVGTVRAVKAIYVSASSFIGRRRRYVAFARSKTCIYVVFIGYCCDVHTCNCE